jgi:hypothetical protein
MPLTLNQLFSRIRERCFTDTPGASIVGRLPIPGDWLNRILRESAPEGDSSPIKGVALAIQEETRATLLVSLDKWPLPKIVEIPFLWDPSLDMSAPGAPVLRLTHEASGLFAPAIPLLIGYVNKEGIRAEGKHITVALGTLLKKQGLDDLIPLISTLELRGAPGKLWLRFTLKVLEK